MKRLLCGKLASCLRIRPSLKPAAAAAASAPVCTGQNDVHAGDGSEVLAGELNQLNNQPTSDTTSNTTFYLYLFLLLIFFFILLLYILLFLFILFLLFLVLRLSSSCFS